MKALRFTKKDTKQFALIWQAFLMGAPEGGYKAAAKQRSCLKLLDALEAISDAETVEGQLQYYRTGDEARSLMEKGGTVELEDAEFEMLKTHFDNIPWKPGLMRDVAGVRDMLDAAEVPAPATKAKKAT